jgi:hypothetical protein
MIFELNHLKVALLLFSGLLPLYSYALPKVGTYGESQPGCGVFVKKVDVDEGRFEFHFTKTPIHFSTPGCASQRTFRAYCKKKDENLHCEIENIPQRYLQITKSGKIVLHATDGRSIEPKTFPFVTEQKLNLTEYRFSNGTHHFIEEARRDALMILARAEERVSTREQRRTIRALISNLQSARISDPGPHREYQTCSNQDAYAFVSPIGGSDIYLCRDFLNTLSHMTQFGRSELALKGISHILVHEATHLAGVSDECRATEIENFVFDRSGEKRIVPSGHERNCR